VPVEALERIYAIVAGDFRPDLTLILDLPPVAGLARAGARGGAAEDRFERKGSEFHEKLRAGFLAIARAAPERCVVLDASSGIEATHGLVWETVRRRLKPA
jgi:dTMP kinase